MICAIKSDNGQLRWKGTAERLQVWRIVWVPDGRNHRFAFIQKLRQQKQRSHQSDQTVNDAPADVYTFIETHKIILVNLPVELSRAPGRVMRLTIQKKSHIEYIIRHTKGLLCWKHLAKDSSFPHITCHNEDLRSFAAHADSQISVLRANFQQFLISIIGLVFVGPT